MQRNCQPLGKNNSGFNWLTKRVRQLIYIDSSFSFKSYVYICEPLISIDLSMHSLFLDVGIHSFPWFHLCFFMLHTHMTTYMIFFCEKDLANETEQSTTQESVETNSESGGLQEDKSQKGKEKEAKEKDESKEVEKEKTKERDPDRKAHDKEKVKSVEGSSLDALLQRLPNSVSRDLIDQLTVIRYIPLELSHWTSSFPSLHFNHIYHFSFGR